MGTESSQKIRDCILMILLGGVLFSQGFLLFFLWRINDRITQQEIFGTSLPSDGAAVVAVADIDPEPPEIAVDIPVLTDEDVPDIGSAANESSIHSEEEEQRYRELEKQLSRRYPLMQPNSYIRLRQKNGRIIRGVFAGIDGDSLVILQGTEKEMILLDSLDRISRIQSDPDYRARAIESRLKITGH
ncbi:MAG: hypothetical protein EOL87_11705 [Spartobacteria bacterium]|nr:hypothetical protein [Spartobacteria bacterium]